MKRDNWPVGDYAIRPMGKPDTCFYCGAKIGEEHNQGCVIRERTIKVRMTLEFVVDVPEHWNEDTINFRYNESSWCASNILNKLQYRDENFRCLCDCATFEYIGEATEEDEEDWGVVKVKELES